MSVLRKEVSTRSVSVNQCNAEVGPQLVLSHYHQVKGSLILVLHCKRSYHDCYEAIPWGLFNILRDEHRLFSKDHDRNGMQWHDNSGFCDNAFKCSTLCYLVCCLLHANFHLLSTACKVSTTFMHLFQILLLNVYS